jgi:hypothetical protein
MTILMTDLFINIIYSNMDLIYISQNINVIYISQNMKKNKCIKLNICIC